MTALLSAVSVGRITKTIMRPTGRIIDCPFGTGFTQDHALLSFAATNILCCWGVFVYYGLMFIAKNSAAICRRCWLNMAAKRSRVCVIGAGIIGLSTAYRLQDAAPDFDITIMSEEFSPNTTGDGSAGFWRPYFIAGTSDEVVWCASQTELEALFELLTFIHFSS